MSDSETKEILKAIRFWLAMILINIVIINLGIQYKLSDINTSIQEQTSCDEILLERE